MTGPAADPDVAVYALRLGDDALVLAQRLAEWSAKAPDLEEDIALTNIGLDLLGQARSLLSYAGQVEGAGRTEDDLAYLRDERAFTNLQIVEHPNGDFATTIARQLCFSTYQCALYAELSSSADDTIAAVAGKGVKEATYHCDHAEQWTLRLGDGTDESHRRMQEGLERVWPYVEEMFIPDALTGRLVEQHIAVDPAGLRPAWDARVAEVLATATLSRPSAGAKPAGGRRGVHTEPFGFLVAEMQHLHRCYPGATW
ncbi:MAG: phenylacetate-CoA oxygenase subunit PaaC [Mycobacteriales bacterium]